MTFVLENKVHITGNLVKSGRWMAVLQEDLKVALLPLQHFE